MLTIASVVVMWVIALITQSTRTWRFFGFVAIETAALVLVGVSHPPVRTLLALLVAVSFAAVYLFAEWIGLGAMTRAERDLDARIHRIARETDGEPPRYAERAEAFDRLLRSAGPRVAPRWRTLLRLLRRSALISERPRVLHARHPDTYTNAAKRYQFEMQRGRSLGGKHWIKPIDEEAALSTYLEDFHEAIPARSMFVGPVEVEHWMEEARAIVDELAVLEMADDQAADTRDLMARAIALELGSYSGDHSEEARSAYREAADRLSASWLAFQRSLMAQSPPRTPGGHPPPEQ